ncbi:MAG: helix-turn-helix domain-containing protein [Chloroflexi bacterium]|nr:helix-turn-helix domain-containing protein [Chloroflexota bacterium]
MFKIGEFARIANIGVSLLRHYDRIGLFKPAYVDPESGYRFYHSEQLSDINRIIALKDLGFSLEEVSQLVNDNISTEEIRGMLILRKSQIREALREEAARLRHVETRLDQIERSGQLLEVYDITTKSLPAQQILTTRGLFPDFNVVVQTFRQVALPERIDQFGPMIAIGHNAEPDHTKPVDLEFGYILRNPVLNPPTSFNDLPFAMRELEGCDLAACVIQTERDVDHIVSGALGIWLDNNGYRMAGIWREVYHQLTPTLVLEHQVPIEKRS